VTRPLSDLNLTHRARSLLVSAGIQTVDALCERTATDLLNLRGFGLGCLDEVREELAAVGRALTGEEVAASLTPSEVAVARVLSAYATWQRAPRLSSERGAVEMGAVRQTLADAGFLTGSDEVSLPGRALLVRARKAGAL
jgi:hypothetical protein